ncbi:DUF5677 domain-containing protein [Silvimonas iriomotensis]|uniref:Uncharacterized protein n=1 Tax=Silvimonas iriomotensis TaxID=449662 RepID=A0ABQ2P4E4_9NEIS|nr:DUF5677 domain-containing protein [Silvimonas iriomotensis]GGP18147.1 hypothetical protein GCM10010970_03410 [Silvimonas iriomotensis]
MPNLEGAIQASHEIKDAVEAVLLVTEVQDSGEARVGQCLCLTICEQYVAMLQLVDAGSATQAPILIRPMLESLADLLNLVANADYLNQLHFKAARENRETFRRYLLVPDMQDDAAALADMHRIKDEADQKYQELRALGFEQENMETTLLNAGLEHDYVAYRVLCAHTHNQFVSLLARHAGVGELRYRDQPARAVTFGFLKMATAILGRTIQTLPAYTLHAQADIDALIDRINAIWDERVGE